MLSSKYTKRLGETVPYKFFECMIIRNMFYAWDFSYKEISLTSKMFYFMVLLVNLEKNHFGAVNWPQGKRT